MAKVYVGIGSNIDKQHHILEVIEELSEQFSSLEVSPIYESSAEGFEGDDFYNLVVEFETELSPTEVYQVLRHIESSHGRQRLSGNQFVARTLDLDQLLYNDLEIDDGYVSIPNQDILDYAFVLKPLVDIARDVQHPTLKVPLSQLWQEFDKELHGLKMVLLVDDNPLSKVSQEM